MVISDPRFGAEIVTAKGKTHTFDSIECMAAYVQENDAGTSDGSLWVTPFDRPDALVAANGVHFLRSEQIRSPMGLNLTAFSPAMSPDQIRNAFSGRILTWEEVLDLVKREWSEGPPRQAPATETLRDSLR